MRTGAEAVAARRDLARAGARLALALVSGAALASSFPPLSQWWVAPLAVAGLTGATWRTGPARGAVVGLAFGLAFFLPLLRWARVGGDDAWLLLAASQSLPLAALGAGLALVTRLSLWPLAVPALWVLQEAVRGRWPFGGMPWGRLAFSQPDTPFTPLAALGGAPLVTAVTAFAGQLLLLALLALLDRSRRGATTATAVAVGVVVPALSAASLPTSSPSGTANVALVQARVPDLGLGALFDAESVLERHAHVTDRLAVHLEERALPPPDLVVWPENSSNLDPLLDPHARSVLEAAAQRVDAPLLVGALLDDGGLTRRNGGLIWMPGTGPGAFYVKRHPVPFAEYLPLRGHLAALDRRFELIGKDYEHGRRPGVFRIGSALVGDVICYEAGYDRYMRDVVRTGAQLVVVQSNSALFPDTAQAQQQLAMARLRAVEHGRAVVVSSLGGSSAVIHPDGDVVMSTPVNAAGFLVADVPLRHDRRLSTKLGEAPEWSLAIAAGVALLAGARSTRRGTDAGWHRRAGAGHDDGARA